MLEIVTSLESLLLPPPIGHFLKFIGAQGIETPAPVWPFYGSDNFVQFPDTKLWLPGDYLMPIILDLGFGMSAETFAQLEKLMKAKTEYLANSMFQQPVTGMFGNGAFQGLTNAPLSNYTTTADAPDLDEMKAMWLQPAKSFLDAQLLEPAPIEPPKMAFKVSADYGFAWPSPKMLVGMFADFGPPSRSPTPKGKSVAECICEQDALRGYHGTDDEYVWSPTLQAHVRIGTDLKAPPRHGRS
jgi:hypothetical protein